MWIVRLALRRPYTFAVLATLILVLGILAIVRTPTDIFPNINIPVISIIWSYNGLVPQEAQNTALSDEVTAVNILGRRMASAVLLIQALGGGWDRTAIPERPECCGKLARTSD